METIIELENSDSCVVRVVAFAIKFFSSLILIGSIVGIWPWMCAHEEYLLQRFEGRVAVLPSVEVAEENVVVSPAAPHSESRSLPHNSAELRASVDRLHSSQKQDATPARGMATPEYSKVVREAHECAIGRICEAERKLDYAKSQIESIHQNSDSPETHLLNPVFILLSQDRTVVDERESPESFPGEQLEERVETLIQHLETLERLLSSVNSKIEEIKPEISNRDLIRDLDILSNHLKQENPAPKTPSSPPVKRQLLFASP